MLYVPTVMLYFVGVSVYVLGPSHEGLADNKTFALIVALALLVLLVVLNIVGLGVGKWINNLGGIGTGIAAAVLIGLGLVIWLRFGTTVTCSGFRDSRESAFRAEFVRRDLLWAGGAGTGVGHGRRNPGPKEDFARRGRRGAACSPARFISARR